MPSDHQSHSVPYIPLPPWPVEEEGRERRDGGREGGREGGKEGGREGGREGGGRERRDGGREEGGRERVRGVIPQLYTICIHHML